MSKCRHVFEHNDGGGKNLVSLSSGSSCFLSMVINVCFPMMMCLMFYINLQIPVVHCVFPLFIAIDCSPTPQPDALQFSTPTAVEEKFPGRKMLPKKIEKTWVSGHVWLIVFVCLLAMTYVNFYDFQCVFLDHSCCFPRFFCAPSSNHDITSES